MRKSLAILGIASIIILGTTLPCTTLLGESSIPASGTSGISNYLDFDKDNDGMFGNNEVLEAVDLYLKGKYDHTYDTNHNGKLEKLDRDRLIGLWLKNYKLVNIEAEILTGEQVTITGWGTVKAVRCEINQCTGMPDCYQWHSLYKWCSTLTPECKFELSYINPLPVTPEVYVCRHQAADMMIAGYQGFGSGVFLMGASLSHAYNILYKGGDWTQLSSWAIFHGKSFQYLDASEVDNEAYQTRWIFLPVEDASDEQKKILCNSLNVDYHNGTVSMGNPVTIGELGGNLDNIVSEIPIFF